MCFFNNKIVTKPYDIFCIFITYEEDIKNSINHLKDKTIRNPKNIPPYFIKYAIPSKIFPL